MHAVDWFTRLRVLRWDLKLKARAGKIRTPVNNSMLSDSNFSESAGCLFGLGVRYSEERIFYGSLNFVWNYYGIMIGHESKAESKTGHVVSLIISS